MPLYNNLLIDRDREEGTIGSETMENIGNYLGKQYQKLPEDFRTGLKEGTANNLQAVQEWNRQKREENYWGGIGPLDPAINLIKAYETVASPIKKELSIRTGLAPSVIDTGEVLLDIATTPAIPLTAKKAKIIFDDIIIKRLDQIPNPFKVGEFAGGTGTGFGPGTGDVNPIKITKKSAPGTGPAPEPGWIGQAESSGVPRIEMTPSNKVPPPKKSLNVPTTGKIKTLNPDIDANVDKFKAILEYPDLSPTDAGKWKNKVIDFLNQANDYRNKQLAYDPKNTRPLDGFEFIETVGRKKVNTKSRSLIGPDGRIWTVRGPSGTGKNAKGWRIKSRQQLTDYSNKRAFRDLTSSPEQALARRRIDEFRSNENKILKAKREALRNKGTDITKEEADWLEWATHQEYYGEHIRRLNDANPYWRTPEYLKGTMKRGDVANYQVFSNQIEKTFKDKIEDIIYGTRSKKHYGGYLSTTGNKVTLGMTNDLTSLTLEEILPSGRLQRIGEIPLSRAYEEGVDLKKLVAEYLGPPPTVLKFTYKNPGQVKALTRIEDYSTYIQDLIMDRSDKKEGLFPTKRDTILKKTKYLGR